VVEKRRNLNPVTKERDCFIAQIYLIDVAQTDHVHRKRLRRSKKIERIRRLGTESDLKYTFFYENAGIWWGTGR
jgi:hypothetical protein